MSDYLHNCWYMAAWSDECAQESLLARRLLDMPILVYRGPDGAVTALIDRCPHRFAPLSRGHVANGSVVCGYHGLAFGPDGRCTANPHGPVTSAMRVRAFPVIERHRAIWIWPGDPDLADPALLPDLSFVDRTPDTAFSKGYLNGPGHYQLFVDNILDLTHADFLHPDTLGGGAFTRTKDRLVEKDASIAIHWHAFDETPSPVSATMRGSQERVDSWTEVEWHAPAIMTLKSGSVPAGTAREAGGNVMNLHIMTPESSTSTHYFYASTRDFAVEDEALNERFAQLRDRIFATEDKPMIAAQFERMEGSGFWDLKPVLLRIDQGAVLVRRRIEAMIAAEAIGGRSAH